LLSVPGLLAGLSNFSRETDNWKEDNRQEGMTHGIIIDHVSGLTQGLVDESHDVASTGQVAIDEPTVLVESGQQSGAERLYWQGFQVSRIHQIEELDASLRNPQRCHVLRTRPNMVVVRNVNCGYKLGVHSRQRYGPSFRRSAFEASTHRRNIGTLSPVEASASAASIRRGV